MTTLQEKTRHTAPQSASCGSTTGVDENASFSNSTATYPHQSYVNIESVKKEEVENWEIAEENIEVKPEEIITAWALDEAAPQQSQQHLEEQAFLDTKIDIQEEQLIKNEAALEDIKRTKRRIKKACFRELVKRLSIVCDLCDDDSAQRAIKLNAKERFAAAVVLKKSLSIGLRPKKILLRKIPAQSCGRCFTKIVLFATRLKEKLEAYQPKRKPPQMEPPHGYECQCQDCQDQFGQLNLIVRGIEASQSSASTMESVPQAPYETQQSHLLNLDIFHPVHSYPNTCMGNLLNISISSTPQTCFGATSTTPYSPYQSYSGYYQQFSSRSCGFQPTTVIHSQEAVAETSSRDSTLPTMLEDFEKETRTDPNQSSVSGAHHQNHLEEPSTSRRTTKICGHCQKQFTHTGDFRKHLRKHTKEKPYACKQCDKSFSHTSNLHRHERSHTGDRPYKCEFCNKEFNRKDKLESHKKSKSCKSRRKDGRK